MLLIPLDMPKNCVDCFAVESSASEGNFCGLTQQYIEYGTVWNKRQDNCPLVEVPPHGRLIDADALGKYLMKRWNVNDDHDFCNKEVWNGIKEAKTVIPTDKEATP